MAAIVIPRTLAQADASWLTSALHAGGRFFTADDARVVTIEQGGPVAGIAVTSTVVRLRLTIEPAGAGPSNAVIKLHNPAWTHGSALHEREVMFYQQLAARAGVPVPACYFAAFRNGEFVLVMEDIGDAEPGAPLQGVSGADADVLFDTMATLHRTWWQSPTLIEASWPTKTYTRDALAGTMGRFRDAWPKLVAHDLFEVSDALATAVGKIGPTTVDDILAINSGPRTLVHSDLHVENFVLDGERLIAFDWQNASFANPVFDVRNGLSSLAGEVTTAERERLLARYHEGLDVSDYRFDVFRSHVSAALRQQFIGTATWFVVFETENLRDAATVQGHWTRLAAALLADT